MNSDTYDNFSSQEKGDTSDGNKNKYLSIKEALAIKVSNQKGGTVGLVDLILR